MTRRLAALTALCLSLSAAASADQLDEAATALFVASFSDNCFGAVAEDGRLTEPPERFQAIMTATYGDPQPVVLWQFLCEMGAYNVSSVFLIHTEYDGLRPLALAEPGLHIVNEDPEQVGSPVKEIKVVGWAADFRATNADFDPASGQLTSYAKWRGLGDSYSSATYILRDGAAQLVAYEADATDDGEVEPQLKLTFP